MASITTKKRKNGTKYYICYRVPDENGALKQFWVPCEDRKEAVYLLDDVAEAEKAGKKYVKPQTYAMEGMYPTHREMLVSDLMERYIAIGGAEWQASTLHGIKSTVENYILPYIGTIPVAAITPRFVQDYYNDLLTRDAKAGHLQKSAPPKITPRTVREVHKILRPAFNYAVVWGEISVNPTFSVKLPKMPKYVRQQWTEEEVKQAIKLCTNARLRLSIGLMFSATLRSGELSGLTWDCIDMSGPDAVCLRVEKTVRRLYRDAIKDTGARDIIRIFPAVSGGKKTVMVLKGPKTGASVRTVYIPDYVAHELKEYKEVQDQQKEFLGSDYHDYGLVIAQDNGAPYDVKDIAKQFKRFIKREGLREVDFYSLRHAGATAKLRVSHNIKAVQGDMGHASPEMLTKVYATIVDEDRKENAVLIQNRVFEELAKEGSGQD